MKRKGIIARLIAATMLVSMISGVNYVSDANAAAKAPKLSTTKKTLNVGKSFTLKVKKNGAKISKTTWKTSKKKVATLTKASKTSVKVNAKTVGTSKVTATVKYKVAGKTKTKKLKCNVYVKPKEQAAPTQAVTTNVPQGGGSIVTPTVAPTATPSPTPKPYYYTYDYFAMFDGSKATKAENFYVNFVLSDSWSTNTKLSAIESLEFLVDSESSFDLDLYVSEWECDMESAKKIATVSINGTKGQEIYLEDEIRGNSIIAALDSTKNGRISFGFSPTDGNGKFVLHDMYVNYYNNNTKQTSHHKAAISVVTSSIGSATTKYNADKAAAKEEERSFSKILSDYENHKYYYSSVKILFGKYICNICLRIKIIEVYSC